MHRSYDSTSSRSAMTTEPFPRRDDRVTVGDVAFDRATEADVIASVISSLDRGRGGRVVTPNVSVLRRSHRPEVAQLIADSEIVVCDGMPVVWASHLQGTPLPERVTGASLLHTLSAAAARSGRSVFFLGGMPGAARTAARRISREVPSLRVAGWSCPPLGFDASTTTLDAAVDDVVHAAPDIVFVGLGFPKQERFAHYAARALPGTWFIGCGAAIDFASGYRRRAPMWMQENGLEWLHRLAAEPRRLGPRYTADAPFALRLLGRSLGSRWSRHRRSGGMRSTP